MQRCANVCVGVCVCVCVPQYHQKGVIEGQCWSWLWLQFAQCNEALKISLHINKSDYTHAVKTQLHNSPLTFLNSSATIMVQYYPFFVVNIAS